MEPGVVHDEVASRISQVTTHLQVLPRLRDQVSLLYSLTTAATASRLLLSFDDLLFHEVPVSRKAMKFPPWPLFLK
jgi:hypothetical protein